MQIKKIIWSSLILLLVTSGCQLFSSHYVETVVEENYIDYWRLSPDGNYLVYGAPRGKGYFLLDLTTGQKHEFSCTLLWWDSYLFGCYEPLKLSVVDAKTRIETPLISIDLAEKTEVDKPNDANVLFVKQLLIKARMIYRPEWITDTIYILSPDYQLNSDQNYIVSGLTNPDEFLAEFTVVNITRGQPSGLTKEKTFAPNDLYYYDFTMDGFAIFTTSKDEMVAKFVPEDAEHLEVRGWAADSSGVYFTNYLIGFIGSGKPKKIKKLKIPDE